jgi:hypothetical protein
MPLREELKAAKTKAGLAIQPRSYGHSRTLRIENFLIQKLRQTARLPRVILLLGA